MYDFSSLLGHGIVGFIFGLIFLIAIFFIAVAFNALLYHIGSLFLKFNKDYMTAFRLMFKTMLVYFVIGLLFAIIEAVLYFIPGINFIAVFISWIFNLILMFLFYYLLYKYSQEYYGIDSTQAVYGVLVFFVINLVVWIIVTLIIVFLIFLIAGIGLSSLGTL